MVTFYYVNEYNFTSTTFQTAQWLLVDSLRCWIRLIDHELYWICRYLCWGQQGGHLLIQWWLVLPFPNEGLGNPTTVWSVLAWIVSFEMDLCIVSSMEFLNQFSSLRCGVLHAPLQNLTRPPEEVSISSNWIWQLWRISKQLRKLCALLRSFGWRWVG